MADRWSLEGTCFDACDCTTLCPCNYGQDATNATCTAAIVYHIQKGSYGSTKLDGLTIAGIMRSAQKNFFAGGAAEAGWILDERANPEQRRVLETLVGGKAGGLFGMFATMVKKDNGVTYAPFQYKNDEKAWSVKAGKQLEAQGGFAKAPAGFPVESVPKRVNTYDLFFGPSMDKVVGIAERFTGQTGGVTADFTGRNSTAGKYKLTGP